LPSLQPSAQREQHKFKALTYFFCRGYLAHKSMRHGRSLNSKLDCRKSNVTAILSFLKHPVTKVK